jgi:hypothetical protein
MVDLLYFEPMMNHNLEKARSMPQDGKFTASQRKKDGETAPKLPGA